VTETRTSVIESLNVIAVPLYSIFIKAYALRIYTYSRNQGSICSHMSYESVLIKKERWNSPFLKKKKKKMENLNLESRTNQMPGTSNTLGTCECVLLCITRTLIFYKYNLHHNSGVGRCVR
jgi:hypothetical protein